MGRVEERADSRFAGSQTIFQVVVENAFHWVLNNMDKSILVRLTFNILSHFWRTLCLISRI